MIVYDIEIFPNWICVCTLNTKNNEKREFVWSQFVNTDCTFDEYVTKGLYNAITQDDRALLFEYIRGEILVGYNNISFDNPLLNKMSTSKSIYQCWEYAQCLINSPFPPKSNYPTIDLMTLIFNEEPKGLKLVGTNLNSPKIQDFPIHFKSIISKDLERNIIDYCHNDVELTKSILDFVEDEIKMRVDIGNRYRKDPAVFVSDAESVMADKLMRALWVEAGNSIPYKHQIPDFEDVYLKDVISDKIKFKTPYLQLFLEDLKNQVVDKDTKFSRILLLEDIEHKIAKGGIHGSPQQLVLEATDEYFIVDWDVGSFYPFLMINLEIFPPQLGVEFLEFFKRMVYERMEDKSFGRTLEAGAKKIIINSIYGKMGKEFHWLSTLEGMYKVTLNGQLFLLMLMEEMILNNIWVFYSNTDGISVYVHKSKMDLMNKIAKDWENYTQLTLERADYQKCVFNNVNNYIIRKTDGKFKAKGNIFNEDNHLKDLKKSLNAPVIAIALRKFFFQDIPIIESLKNHYKSSPEAIYDFCYATKANRDFKMLLEEVDYKLRTKISNRSFKPIKTVLETNILKTTEIQKSVRYYVSKTNHRLRKQRIGGEKGIIGSYTELVADHNIFLFNDYAIDHPEPDWEYYTKKCYDIIKKFKILSVT